MFKPGDKVRLLDNKGYEYVPIGSIFTVEEIYLPPDTTQPMLAFLERPSEMYAYRFEHSHIKLFKDKLNNIVNET